MKTTYTPPKMTPARPGAEAATKVPSLQAGKRKPHKAPVAQCVSRGKATSGDFAK